MSKTSHLFRQAVLMGCLASLFFCPRAAVAVEKADSAAKIKGLLQERLKIVQTIQKIVNLQYERGTVDYDVLREADESVLKARLDLCGTKQDRVQVYQDMVKEAEAWQKFADAHFESGFNMKQVDVLKSAAYLLECRIGLERAQADK